MQLKGYFRHPDIVQSRTFLLTVMLIAVALIFTGSVLAQQVSYTIDFSQSDLSFSKVADYDVVKLKDGDYLSETGKPFLPSRTIRIALPAGFAVQSLEFESIFETQLSGSFSILPAQPPLRIGQSLDDVEFIQPDQAIYASDAPYPSALAELVGQSDLAGQSYAVVRVFPIQYSPAAHELTLHESINITLHGTGGYVCGDYMPQNISKSSRSKYEDIVRRLVVNPNDAVARTSGYKSSTSLPPGGPFDHVLITSSSIASYWEPLVEWHNKKGVRDTIITTSFIYGNYTGSNNQEKIRNFVIDAHDNWGTVYFMIGGEHGNVPFKSSYFEGDLIPSDHYYADYDDDWQLEVFVGRVTADNSTQISRFIDKVLKYELDPDLSGYALDATIAGMDLTTAMDPPYYTLTAGEELKEHIDTEYIPSRFNVTKVYDSHTGNHKSVFIDALNNGQNLVNHCDHSNYSVMCLGDRNHGWCMHSSEVDNLTNTGQMSVVFSIGCHANEMDYSDCIAEHFVIYNDLQAGVAFTGNTRSGWFYVGDPLSLSSLLDEYWWRAMFVEGKYTLGEMLAYSKNSLPHSGIWQYCQWTLNLLGDPTMTVWTDNPKNLQVSHPSLLPVGSSLFDIHVEDDYGNDIDDALVCLWKEGELYEIATTDQYGNVTMTPDPASVGEMHVTVTKHNIVPYVGSAEATTQNLPPLCQAPGDTLINLCQLEEVCIPIGCYDPNGNLETGPTLIAGPGILSDGYWCYTPSGDEFVSVTIGCEDSGGLTCETTFEVHFNPNDTPVCDPPDDATFVQCAPAEIVVPLGITDQDGNIEIIEVLSGPGYILHGNWSYLPNEGHDTLDILVRCTDVCGEYCEESFTVITHVNYSPVCELPNDSVIVQCSPEPVSLPMLVYDPDGAAPQCEKIIGPGELIDGNWVYSPTGGETVYITIRCTDTCGVYCDNQFDITFDTNDPPTSNGTSDTTVVMCDMSEQAVQIPAEDPNGNIVGWDVLQGPGSAYDGFWHFTPSGEDTVDLTIRCTDECGEYADVDFSVRFEMNVPPVCAEINDTTIAMETPEEIKIACPATDENGNLSGCTESQGRGYVLDGHWYYTPTGPETLYVTIQCGDDCDTQCQTSFTVTILMLECGDANSDFTVDIDDVVFLINYIFGGGPPPASVEIGDVDCSDNIDIDDVVYLINYIFGGGPAPCAGC